ncbi:hypothetical protein ACPBEI_08890 [Latilactobacillus sakei]
MQRMINKFGYQKTKWGMIALVTILTIILVSSTAMAVATYRAYTNYATITMQ